MATLTRLPAQDVQFIALESRLTFDDWARLPETKPHYELIEGELKRKMPTQQHARAAFRLALQLAVWGDLHGWTFQTEGLGLRANNFNSFVPDVIGFAPNTVPQGDTVYTPSAFLVAEVLSPGTKANDRDAKMRGYAEAEVELYLLVDAIAQTIEVHRLDGQIYGEPEVLTGDAIWAPTEFEGLQLELAKLWM